MTELEFWTQQIKKGRISRREFMGRVAALGVTATAAATLLTKAGVAATPKRGGSAKFGLAHGATSDSATTQMQSITPAFVLFNFDKYIAATHTDYAYCGPASLYPGLTTPAKPGETILLFGTGFGLTTPAVVNGQHLTATARLASPVTIRFGSAEGHCEIFNCVVMADWLSGWNHDTS